jgi:hypothetical protein
MPGSSTTRYSLVIAAALTAACPGQGIADPPIDHFYGAYEIVGRAPGATAETYRGWARLAIEGEVIEVDRCVDGVHTTGLGHQVIVEADEMTAIEFEYLHDKDPYRARCRHSSDFDDLPRFTCYTYPRRRPDLAVPGLETYFAIVWPVPLDFFNCGQ